MDKGLDNRSRDKGGTIRKKRNDTKIKTLRNLYGKNFAPSYDSDETLKILLEKEHKKSLSEFLKEVR
ncbi:Uncharacterised protein [Legionella steigerwaltii]|uniref:Uncharacterized protein n=1 Tax=Legionella steigerwaltii TaxID=460 RepID=A0A378L8Y2_9GAMM|nr:hypothetical protein [Legionella steigerwaltii]KTD80779.1 hypothetical protein Lstg_0006 [Legionella steigerwaltii]STY23535.1 Uncharacterised protein [Legionella steigerwaltii]